MKNNADETNLEDAYTQGVDIDVSDLNVHIDRGNEFTGLVSKVWERTALSAAIDKYVRNERKKGRKITVRSESENNIRELTFKDTGARLIYYFIDKHLKKAHRVLREETLFKIPAGIRAGMDQIITFSHKYTSITSVCELDKYTKIKVNEEIGEIERLVSD